MKRYMLPSNNYKLSKIEIYYHNSVFYLAGFKMYDIYDECILEVGQFQFQMKITVELKDDERLIGVRFRYHNKHSAALCDFEFMVAKSKVITLY